MASLFKAESHSAVWTEHILRTHSSADGHSDCFRVLAVVASVAGYVGAPIPLRDPAAALWGVCVRVGLLDQRGCV